MPAHAPQTVTTGGLNPGFAAVTTNADTITDNNGDLIAHVKNASAGTSTFTLVAAGTCSQGGTHNVAVVVPAGSERLVRVPSPERVGGTVSITFSAATSVTLAVLRLAAV